MRRHKIVVQITLLVFSVIGFALAAPVVVRRGIRVDVAEDVTIVRKHWSPSGKWWTNAANKMDTPPSSRSSDSHYRLERELWSHYPRSPMDSNDPPQPSWGSTDSDNFHSLPVGPSSPAPAHSNVPLGIDSNNMPQPSPEPTDSGNSHPSPAGPPAPAHNKVPLDIDLNAIPEPSPEPSPEPTDSGNSHHVSVGSPAPALDNLPLNIDLNASPEPSPEPADPYMTPSQTPSDVTISPSAWYEMSVFEYPKSQSSSPSPDPNLPPPRGNLDIDLNRPLSPGPADDQPEPASRPLDRESSKRPYIPSESDDEDLGPSRRPYPPQDPGPSTWAYPPWDPGPSTWAYPPSDPGPSTWTHPPSGPTLSLHPPSDPTLPLFPPSDPTLSLYPPSSPGPVKEEPDPAPSTYPPSDPTTHPPLSPGTVNQESDIFFSKLFESTGRFKRRISASRSVNQAQRELQGTLDYTEYVSASTFPFPPCHKHPDFEFLQLLIASEASILCHRVNSRLHISKFFAHFK